MSEIALLRVNNVTNITLILNSCIETIDFIMKDK